jgi:hypothetical protein
VQQSGRECGLVEGRARYAEVKLSVDQLGNLVSGDHLEQVEMDVRMCLRNDVEQ